MRGKVNLEGNISLRMAGPADAEFLSTVFRQTRSFIYDYAENEYDYKHMVVEHQEQLRERGYGTTHPDSIDFIIEDAGVAIGRVQLDFGKDVVHVVDIALEAKARGRGIGEIVLRGIQATAQSMMVPVMLAVNHSNQPARMLYTKLGFQLHEKTSMQDFLIWYPKKSGLIL